MTGDIWSEQLQPPKPLSARHRTVSWCLALVAVIGGGLASIGSSLTWTYYPVGETQKPVYVSGLDWAMWGRWTLILGIGVVLSGLLAAPFVSHFRSSLVFVPAAAGLALSALSCVREPWIETEGRVAVHVQAGLALTVAAYAATVMATALFWVIDWHRDQDPGTLNAITFHPAPGRPTQDQAP